MDLDSDPLESEDQDLPSSLGKAVGPRSIKKMDPREAMLAIAERQRPYFSLSNQFQALFYELPEITTREVDIRIKAMHETFMEVCEKAGISRMSMPQLKECCGRDRKWQDPVQLPMPAPILESVQKSGLGDLIAKLTAFCGFKPCEGCKRRQAFLNKFRWPWAK